MVGGKVHRGRSDYGPKGGKAVSSGNLEGDKGIPPGMKGKGEQPLVKGVCSHVNDKSGGVPPMTKPARRAGVKD